jgi:hypothetical protein
MSVYSSTTNITSYGLPVPQSTGLPGSWAYQSCIAEPPNGGRVFPYQIDMPQNATATACLTLCAEYGYGAAGLEYAMQCCRCFCLPASE